MESSYKETLFVDMECTGMHQVQQVDATYTTGAELLHIVFNGRLANGFTFLISDENANRLYKMLPYTRPELHQRARILLKVK